jgi:hypothetical protein
VGRGADDGQRRLFCLQRRRGSFLFDDVPGGAGHVQRLEDQEELIAVLEAALARVVQCGGCDTSASCYRCLRSYRNQFCHDLLVRQGAADYLEELWGSVAHDPESDRLYTLPDKANALRTALRESCRAALEATMQVWLERFTTPLSIWDTVPDGYQVHAIPKGAKVDFAEVFRAASLAPIETVVLQDPYLATEHQLKCLDDFLRAVPWPSTGATIPFEIRTQLSEPDLKDRYSIPTARHLTELKGHFGSYPTLAPNILLQRKRRHALHM